MAIAVNESRNSSLSAESSTEPICLPTSALTFAGFRRWVASEEFPKRGRISFISKEILIETSPEELEHHNQVKMAVSSALFQWVRSKGLGKVYADRALFSNLSAELSTEPDCTFVSLPSLQSGRVKRAPRAGRQGEYMELIGAPDVVVEIISRSSIKKDTQKLRAAYHAAEVPEYWLIRAFDSEIDFRILRRDVADYVATEFRDGWVASTAIGGAARLSRAKDDLGLWDYLLEIR